MSGDGYCFNEQGAGVKMPGQGLQETRGRVVHLRIAPHGKVEIQSDSTTYLKERNRPLRGEYANFEASPHV